MLLPAEAKRLQQRLALAEAVVRAVAAKHDARTVAELYKTLKDEKIALDAYRRGTK
jgi:hypothetical protein